MAKQGGSMVSNFSFPKWNEQMRSKVRFACYSFLYSIVCSQTFAEPTHYPKQEIVDAFDRIKRIPEVSLIPDEVSPNLVWVLPPKIASASVSKLEGPTANLLRCSELVTLSEIFQKNWESLKEFRVRWEDKKKELVVLQDQKNLVDREAAALFIDESVSAYENLDSLYRTTSARIKELYNMIQGQPYENREALYVEIDRLKEENDKVYDKLLAVHSEQPIKIEKYKKKKAEANSLKNSIDDTYNFYTKLRNEYTDFERSLTDATASYSRLMGGTTRLKYRSEWDNYIRQLQVLNPTYSFEKIKTKNAELSAGSSSQNSFGANGAVGRIFTPGATIVEGNAVVKFNEFPEVLDATSELSLIGACPLVHPEWFPTATPVASTYGIVIGYDIETLVNLDISADYNFYKMYQRVEEHKRKGGIFSSSSSATVSEKTILKDSLVVDFNDPEHIYPLDKKLDYITFIRSEVIKRFVMHGTQNLHDRMIILDMVNPPLSAAGQLAEQLGADENCQRSSYCKYSALGLGFLNAAFGSTKISTVYTNTMSENVQDRYHERTKFTQSFITSFAQD